MAAPKLMSVGDYFRTPETLKPMELVYGAIRVADSPRPRHQAAVAKRALIVQPDLFFVSHNRAWIVSDRVRGAPDLVIEVLSPEPRIGRSDERVQWFAEHSVRECWLVHQEQRSIAVIEFARCRVAARDVYGRQDVIKSAVLPAFDSLVESILTA